MILSLSILIIKTLCITLLLPPALPPATLVAIRSIGALNALLSEHGHQRTLLQRRPAEHSRAFFWHLRSVSSGKRSLSCIFRFGRSDDGLGNEAAPKSFADRL